MQPTIEITEKGFLLMDNGTRYIMEWVGEKLMVSGGDVCYYLVETARGLEQIDCATSLATVIFN